MIIIKVVFACIICLLLSIIVSEFNLEFKLYFTAIFGIVVFLLLLGEISTRANELQSMFNFYNVELDNINTLVKIVLIAYVCDFISLICKDLNHESIGKKVELAGKFIILIISFDILEQFIHEVLILFNG